MDCLRTRPGTTFCELKPPTTRTIRPLTRTEWIHFSSKIASPSQPWRGYPPIGEGAGSGAAPRHATSKDTGALQALLNPAAANKPKSVNQLTVHSLNQETGIRPQRRPKLCSQYAARRCGNITPPQMLTRHRQSDRQRHEQI